MKFANIKYLGYDDGKDRIGVGDYIQLMAIEHLYRQMGIKDVTMLDLSQIETYDGEYLILPINQLIGGKLWLKENGDFRFSDKIIPVFLGVSLRKGFFKYTEHNLNILRKSAPVGCRDYYTYKQLCNYNIPAYVSGCLSLTLPKREREGGTKIILADAPETLRQYIPKEFIESDCEIRQQVFQVSHEDFLNKSYAWELTREVYDYYASNAKLIITSRLHCAAPCLAMGIPVIIAKQYKSYTFDWLEKFVKIYTEEDYAKISWQTQAVNIEHHKEKYLNFAKKRLLQIREKYSYLEWNEFFDVDIEEYVDTDMSINHFIRQMQTRYSYNDKFDYAIWGISSTADKIYEHLCRKYPNARLVKVIDSFGKKVFQGLESEFPSVLNQHDDFLTIVATINCMDSGAKPLFAKLGKPSEEFIYAADGFIADI